jgi:hypothetical protein
MANSKALPRRQVRGNQIGLPRHWSSVSASVSKAPSAPFCRVVANGAPAQE